MPELAAVARYPWMFRAAAAVYLLLGASMAWRYGLTDYDAAHRPWGVGGGLMASLIGIFLFRRAKLAVGLSALVAAVIACAAAVAVAAPTMRGVVVLAFVGVAVVFGLYAALAGRALLEKRT